YHLCRSPNRGARHPENSVSNPRGAKANLLSAIAVIIRRFGCLLTAAFSLTLRATLFLSPVLPERPLTGNALTAARCSTIKGCTCLRRTKVSSRANDLSMLLSLSAAALKEPLSSIRTATTTALNRLFGFLTYRAFNRHSNTGLCQVTDRTRKRSVIKHLHRCSVVRVSRRHRLILYRTNHHRELSL